MLNFCMVTVVEKGCRLCAPLRHLGPQRSPTGLPVPTGYFLHSLEKYMGVHSAVDTHTHTKSKKHKNGPA